MRWNHCSCFNARWFVVLKLLTSAPVAYKRKMGHDYCRISFKGFWRRRWNTMPINVVYNWPLFMRKDTLHHQTNWCKAHHIRTKNLNKRYEMLEKSPKMQWAMLAASSVEHKIGLDFQSVLKTSKKVSILLNITKPVWPSENGMEIKWRLVSFTVEKKRQRVSIYNVLWQSEPFTATKMPKCLKTIETVSEMKQHILFGHVL